MNALLLHLIHIIDKHRFNSVKKLDRYLDIFNESSIICYR